MRANLTIFSNTVYTTLTQVQDQAIQKFNEATRGGLVLTSSTLNQGDFHSDVMWARINGLVRRRNPYADGAIETKQLSQLVNANVKIAGGIYPIALDPGMLKWIKKDQREAGAVIGKQMAEDSMADMLNTAIMALVASMGQRSDLITEATGQTTLRMLNKAASKFGDNAQALRCWLMHSTSAFDLYDQSLANQERLFNFGNVNVQTDGFGRTLVITDSPSLVTATTGEGASTAYHILGLNSAAAVVEQNNDEFTDNVDTRNGNENIQATYQAEWTYNLGLRGFTWDTTNGGKAPTSAALATPTNWDWTTNTVKDGPGVLLNVTAE